MEEIKNKLYNDVKLNTEEIQDFIHEDYFPLVQKNVGENRRWSREVEIIRDVGGRFFSCKYEQGLTESQEDGYFDFPIEVKKEIRTKTITETVYVNIK